MEVQYLSDVFVKHKELQDFYKQNRPVENPSLDSYLELHSQAMMSELLEVLELFEGNIDVGKRAELEEELIDVLHFLLSVSLDFGIGPNDISDYIKSRHRCKDKAPLRYLYDQNCYYTPINLKNSVIKVAIKVNKLMCESNWKVWKNKKDLDHDKIKKLIYEIFHDFLISCFILNMDVKLIYDKYIEKNTENFNRQFGKSKKAGYQLGGNNG